LKLPRVSYPAKALRGRRRGNCHPGELGTALRKLGFKRERRWHDSTGFCALWYPPNNSISNPLVTGRPRPSLGVHARIFRSSGGRPSYPRYRVPGCSQVHPDSAVEQTAIKCCRLPKNTCAASLMNFFEQPARQLARVHRHQGRLFGSGSVQGDIAASLTDDIKPGLFQRSHQFSCTRSQRPSEHIGVRECPWPADRPVA
jgi:hypothetical protein